MANIPFNQQTTIPQTQIPFQQQIQPQQFFPQPQGQIFMLNNSSETGNIPIGSGLSAGICLSEGTMYLKSFQNGSPMMLSYKLTPLEGQSSSPKDDDFQKKIYDFLKNYDERLSKIETALQPKEKVGGSKLEWPV